MSHHLSYTTIIYCKIKWHFFFSWLLAVTINRNDDKLWINSLPGEADKDYPIYSTPPVTGFSCKDRLEGQLSIKIKYFTLEKMELYKRPKLNIKIWRDDHKTWRKKLSPTLKLKNSQNRISNLLNSTRKCET